MPRLIVAVKWGASGGRRAILAPGERVQVGRSELAQLVVPHDAQMSSVHFEITWDGRECRFRDLNSLRGTLLNGEAGLVEGVVASGDWLKAGETVISVHREGATPPRSEEESTARFAAAETALTTLRIAASQERLYAVLDGARDERIHELLRESVEEHGSLYDGVQGAALAEVAPYLVHLPAGSRLLDALVREGWGRRWGIYLTSLQRFTAVRRHLRRFLMVTDGRTDERLYFRFYDPTALTIFLRSCHEGQSSQFFDVIGDFIAEDGLSLATFPGPARANGSLLDDDVTIEAR
jgi:hypothetical protein